MEKHSESRLSYLFAHLPLLSSDLFSSDSSHLCFSTVHIVGSIASKLPSIIVYSLVLLVISHSYGIDGPFNIIELYRTIKNIILPLHTYIYIIYIFPIHGWFMTWFYHGFTLSSAPVIPQRHLFRQGAEQLHDGTLVAQETGAQLVPQLLRRQSKSPN